MGEDRNRTNPKMARKEKGGGGGGEIFESHVFSIKRGHIPGLI